MCRTMYIVTRPQTALVDKKMWCRSTCHYCQTHTETYTHTTVIIQNSRLVYIMTCQMRFVQGLKSKKSTEREKLWNYLPLTPHVHYLSQRSSVCPVSERSTVPVVRSKECASDSHLFDTTYLTGHYASKLQV